MYSSTAWNRNSLNNSPIRFPDVTSGVIEILPTSIAGGVLPPGYTVKDGFHLTGSILSCDNMEYWGDANPPPDTLTTTYTIGTRVNGGVQKNTTFTAPMGTIVSADDKLRLEALGLIFAEDSIIYQYGYDWDVVKRELSDRVGINISFTASWGGVISCPFNTALNVTVLE